ncbi:MAG: hypothetical protein AAGF87_03865 [Bacteroidota bacterium]
MSYHNLDPKIEEEALADYGKRQYADFDAARARVQQSLNNKYQYKAGRTTIRQWFGVAASLLLLVTGWWLLRPQLSEAEIKLAEILEAEHIPLATTGESAYRSTDEPSHLQEAISRYEDGDYRQAILHFEESDFTQFNAKQALYYGHCLYEVERREKALSVFAIGLNSQEPQRDASTDRKLQYWTAKTHAAMGRCDLAIVELASIEPPTESSAALAQACHAIIGQP